ncbi:class I tRNA ligase family protein [Patescibacteria group bacterium]|nr:class I tRNA ligase family protein [Patescibacteria group bacterium]
MSRESNKIGIPLPFDQTQVSYVWYDALLNYLTVCQGGDEAFWPGIHVLGKDIARFHVIYWLAMLMSAGFAMPQKEIVTGFFTVDGQKMSKSLGNAVKPLELVEKYGRDAVAFYLFYDLVI